MSCHQRARHASRSVLITSTFSLKRTTSLTSYRTLHSDGRSRLSNFWTPTTLVKQADDATQVSSHELLARAGFLRQAHSGIFHLLPLGLRVQDKLERLIDKHMRSLGATKVSLSSLSTEELWAKSGRLEGRDSEFFRLTDRKGAKFLLSPTHEEEITTIVANTISSHKDLPLRLYQVSRKYRDEARPRQGLLRGREFLMKDLYTFDLTEKQAKATYEDVRRAYCAFLDELRLQYVVANADSGKMGGNLSHEYHFVSSSGEDNVVSCTHCGHAVNEELHAAKPGTDSSESRKYLKHSIISKDRKRLYEITIPNDSGELNLHLLKKLLPDADTSIEGAEGKQSDDEHAVETITIVDSRCDVDIPGRRLQLDNEDVLLTKARDGDQCSQCHTQDSIKIVQAVEIGHTFHLSTRYSAPLSANVLGPDNKSVTVQMGCHGIGVSRLIAAVSGLLADEQGLNWPFAVAPFQAVIVAAPSVSQEDVAKAYDDLRESSPDLDLIIDDRQRQLGWKLNDADLIGYPFIVLLGRKWAIERKVELQCRRLKIKEEVSFFTLSEYMKALAEKL